MNCVIGLCELLLDMDPTPRQREYLDMINQSGGALLAVINDILDLSKIEAGQLEIDPTMTDLRELVDEIVGLVAFSAQAKGLEVVCRFAPGTPERANCDAGRLRQVLTNLLNNAAKFTNSGHIYLNVEPVGEDDTRTFLSFQVKDTGIGIKAEQLTKIFEKFTQADTSPTRRFGGTGLGLAISQRLVALLGGELRASSVEGQGSTFAFTIPVDKAVDEDDIVASVVEKAAADSRQRVLLIAGYQLSGEVLAEQVRQLGHDCQVALGTTAGLNQLEDGSWQVILLDHTLVKDGFEPLCKALEKLDERARPRGHPAGRYSETCNGTTT